MAQPSVPIAPDVIEGGRVLAQLNDWRAILFVLVFLIVFFIFFTIWREWAMNVERRVMRDERADLRDLAKSFAESAGKVADSLADLSTKIAVLSALTARAEAYISKTTKPAGEKNHEGS